MIKFIKRLHNRKIERQIKINKGWRNKAADGVSRVAAEINQHKRRIEQLEYERDECLRLTHEHAQICTELENKLW